MVDDDVADRDVVRSRGGKSRGNTQFVEYITGYLQKPVRGKGRFFLLMSDAISRLLVPCETETHYLEINESFNEASPFR